MQEIEKIVQEASEKVLAALQEKIKEKFVGVEMNFSGSVVLSQISLKIAVKDGEKVAEIQKFCGEMESSISYPEIKFVVRQSN